MRARWAKWGMAVVLGLLGGALGGCGGAGRSAAVIKVTPAVGLYDLSRSIVVSQLDPRESVTVSAMSRAPGGVWSSSATYEADAAGVIDLARTAPRSGSYRGVSPMGLFWSEHFVGAASGPADSAVTRLTVSAGARRLASASVTQLYSGPGVSEHTETLTKVGFVGQYFTPPGSAHRPAVVLWGGSEGGFGVNGEQAALLASHGIPALAMAYFDEPGLPCSLSNIPLEYFAKAIRWLRGQPQVNPGRVWIHSGSRGTEAELLVVAHWPGLAHGVVAEAPSSTVYGAIGGQCEPSAAAAWTLHGKPLAGGGFDFGAITDNRDGSVSDVKAFADALDTPLDPRAARIPVQKIQGPVLLISGGDDQLWPSEIYANQIIAGLRSDPAPHQHLNYAGAGHIVLGLPYAPAFIEEPGPHGGTIDLGGTPSANNTAHEQDWPAMIKFIAKN